jgi:hypothetical protein
MPDDTFPGHPVQTFPGGTPTAQDAANAVGCVGHVIALTPAELARLSNGELADVAQR